MPQLYAQETAEQDVQHVAHKATQREHDVRRQNQGVASNLAGQVQRLRERRAKSVLNVEGQYELCTLQEPKMQKTHLEGLLKQGVTGFLKMAQLQQSPDCPVALPHLGSHLRRKSVEANHVQLDAFQLKRDEKEAS